MWQGPAYLSGGGLVVSLGGRGLLGGLGSLSSRRLSSGLSGGSLDNSRSRLEEWSVTIDQSSSLHFSTYLSSSDLGGRGRGRGLSLDLGNLDGGSDGGSVGGDNNGLFGWKGHVRCLVNCEKEGMCDVNN